MVTNREHVTFHMGKQQERTDHIYRATLLQQTKPVRVWSTNRNISQTSRVSQLVWGANRNDAMIGMVARDGNVYFRSETLSPQELTPRIRQCLRTGSERRVYLRADARVRYEAVKPVLEAIQSAGVEDISVLTDESKAPPSVNNQR